jgi:hypothetical protein
MRAVHDKVQYWRRGLVRLGRKDTLLGTIKQRDGGQMGTECRKHRLYHARTPRCAADTVRNCSRSMDVSAPNAMGLRSEWLHLS